MWPGWALDLPAADYWGQQIAGALTTALTEAEAIQLANAWYAANPPGQQDQKKRDAVAAAALWLQPHLPDLAGLLQPHAAGLVTDGRLIGAASARVMTDGGPLDTGTWKPGDTGEATRVLEGLSIGSGSEDDAAQAADSIARGILTTIGRLLVEGAQAARDAAGVASDLVPLLGDQAKAAAAALGQIVIAVGDAAMDWYQQRQVEYVEWLTDPASDVCPLCAANEADGPVPLGTPFSSGDTQAPAHPHCRCEVVPAGTGRTPPTEPLPQLPAGAEAPTEPLPLPAEPEAPRP